MRTVRAVVEARIQGDGDPRETVQKMLEEGSPHLMAAGVIEAGGEVGPEDRHIASAGDTVVAVLLQHFPKITTDQSQSEDAVLLIADILGNLLAQHLVAEDEVGVAESIAQVNERVETSARSATDRLRASRNKGMN